MAQVTEKTNPQWSSRFAFLMAAIGSSVGLGNFWRFPSEAGEGGGAIFILVYLICVIFVAYPILVAEYTIGRRSAISAVNSIEKIAGESKKSLRWGVIGWIGMITSFLILSFYCVIAGIVLAYIVPSFLGEFQSLSPLEIGQWGDQLGKNIGLVMFYQSLFIALTVFIVARGLGSGIELAAQILMPAFFVMFLFLVIYAIFAGDFVQAAIFLFKPNWQSFNAESVLSAMGQSFFSIGIGSALMITYGSYLSKDINIGKSSAIVAGSDTLVAIIAGLSIFPFVFAYGFSPASGPDLFFKVLPSVFAQMPFGQYLSGFFFILAFFAALTSSIALHEVSVAWMVERVKISRLAASIGLGFMLWVLGTASIFSTAYFDFLDSLTGLLLLPLGGLLIVIFTGWIIKKDILHDELGNMSSSLFKAWYFCTRYIAPIGVGLVLIWGLGEKFGIFKFLKAFISNS